MTGTTSLLRHGSLCTGIGGLDLACETTYSGTLAWYAETEPAPSAVMKHHWPGTSNLGDITDIDWAEIEPVDVLTAGYPCQPFSQAGKRKGTDDPRHLWPYIAQAVCVLRPGRVVLENVAGHLSLGFGGVLADLAEAGFDAEWCLLRASDVGACHRRARLFVVATNADDGSRGDGPTNDREAPTNADDIGHKRGGPARQRGDGPTNDREAPTNAQGAERRGAQRQGMGSSTGSAAEPGERPSPVAWGQYEPAIRRWEHVLGRPAPPPTDNRNRLSPRFVEWMMGYPEGWTDGMTRSQALKALGNAVVPQQAAAAITNLETTS